MLEMSVFLDSSFVEFMKNDCLIVSSWHLTTTIFFVVKAQLRQSRMDVNVTRQNSCFSLHTRSQSIVNSSPLSGNRTSTIVSAPVCCLDPGVWLNCIKLTTRSRSRRSLTRASLQACSSLCGGHNTCSSSLCSSSWSAEMKRSYPRWRGINFTEKGRIFLTSNNIILRWIFNRNIFSDAQSRIIFAER